MQDYVRAYGDGVIDRIVSEGASVSETPIEASSNGIVVSYLLNLGESGEDNLFTFGHDFGMEHYPNEFFTPNSKSVQILLRDQFCPQFKNISVDLGVIFHRDEQGRPRVTFRIVGGKFYSGTGSFFQSPDFTEVLAVSDAASRPSRVVAEVGE